MSDEPKTKETQEISNCKECGNSTTLMRFYSFYRKCATDRCWEGPEKDTSEEADAAWNKIMI